MVFGLPRCGHVVTSFWMGTASFGTQLPRVSMGCLITLAKHSGSSNIHVFQFKSENGALIGDSGLIYSISWSFSLEFESLGGVSSCLPWKACFCCSANTSLFDIAYPTLKRMKIFPLSNLIQQIYKRDLVCGSKANQCVLWAQCQAMGWCGQLNCAGKKHYGHKAEGEECVSVAVTSLVLISCTLELMQPYQFQLLLLLVWTLHLVPISFLRSVIKRW